MTCSKLSRYNQHFQAFVKLMFVFFLLMNASSIAQTCICNIHTTPIDTNNYTVGPNQILCIDSGSVYSGKLSLAGGVVCIKGTANPSSVEFIPTGGSAGVIRINSNGSLSTKTDFSIGTISLIISPKSVLNIAGDLKLIVNGSSVNNQGIINVRNNLKLNPGCTLTNNGNITYQTMQNNNGIVNGSGNFISSTQINQQ